MDKPDKEFYWEEIKLVKKALAAYKRNPDIVKSREKVKALYLKKKMEK